MLAAGLVALGFLVVRGAGGGVTFSGDLSVGGRVEAFALPALESDGTVSYDQFRGRPLVLNFFASWCPYCIAEMPGFERVHQQLGPKVSFLGVSQSDPKNASIDLVRQTGITYATAMDPQGSLFRAFGGLSMPVTVFIAPDGQVVDVHSGQINPPELLQFISTYFGEEYTTAV